MVAGGGARERRRGAIIEADVASSSFVDRRRSSARQRIRLVVVTFDRPRKSSSRSTRTPYRAARCVSMWTRRALALALVAWCALTRAPFASAGGAAGMDDPDARSGRVPICQSCEIVARALETAMYALEEPGTDSAGLTEEEHAQRGARRRRLTHGRSELRIAEVLDTFCEDLDRDDTVARKPNLGACETLVNNHADAVADHVFAEGPKNMRDYLCVRLGRVCPRLVSREEF